MEIFHSYSSLTLLLIRNESIIFHNVKFYNTQLMLLQFEKHLSFLSEFSSITKIILTMFVLISMPFSPQGLLLITREKVGLFVGNWVAWWWNTPRGTRVIFSPEIWVVPGYTCFSYFLLFIKYSNAVILNPSFSLALSRFLLTITTP